MATNRARDIVPMSVTEALNNEELSKKFGFRFVTEDEVPPAPKSKESNTERWSAIKTFLVNDKRAHEQWVMIKEFDTAGGAAAKASRINNDYEKSFPKAEGWEARSEVKEKKDGDNPGKSELFVQYVPAKNTSAK